MDMETETEKEKENKKSRNCGCRLWWGDCGHLRRGDNAGHDQWKAVEESKSIHPLAEAGLASKQPSATNPNPKRQFQKIQFAFMSLANKTKLPSKFRVWSRDSTFKCMCAFVHKTAADYTMAGGAMG